MSDPILFAVKDRVATLTLNRPEHLNAINYALADRLMEHLDAVEADDSIRVVILTGAGNRAFSAGGDIYEFSESVEQGEASAVNAFVRRGQTMTARLEAFPKPVIAAVNGLAYGGGCEITEAVHLAIAADSAVFAKPEILLGMPPTFGGTQRLPRVAGRKRALELLLTGQTFSAEQAVELGLVNHVVPGETLMNEAHNLAARIASQSPRAVKSILTAVARGIDLPIGDGLLVEREQFARMVGTQDLHDGLEAWRSRRRGKRFPEANEARERRRAIWPNDNIIMRSPWNGSATAVRARRTTRLITERTASLLWVNRISSARPIRPFAAIAHIGIRKTFWSRRCRRVTSSGTCISTRRRG